MLSKKEQEFKFNKKQKKEKFHLPFTNPYFVSFFNASSNVCSIYFTDFAESRKRFLLVCVKMPEWK